MTAELFVKASQNYTCFPKYQNLMWEKKATYCSQFSKFHKKVSDYQVFDFLKLSESFPKSKFSPQKDEAS